MATFVTTKAKQMTSLSASLLDKVKVVPNPYLVRANWDVSKNYPNVYFTNLPSKCTIRIYNIAGELIRVLNHEVSLGSNEGSEKWDLLTTFDKRTASGLVLGADAARYRSSVAALRAEAAVSEAAWRESRLARVAVLRATVPLFHTPAGRDLWQARAEANLQAEYRLLTE